MGERDLEVDVDQDVPALLAGGAALANLTWTPQVTSRGCLFVVWAFSVAGLHVTVNRIEVSPRFDRWHRDASLTLLATEGVEVRHNVLDPAFRDRVVRIEGGRPETIHVSGWR